MKIGPVRSGRRIDALPALSCGPTAVAVALVVACAQHPPEGGGAAGPVVPPYWSVSAAAPQPVQSWLRDFGDSRLNALVAEAISGNFDLQGAAARVETARARAKIAGAGRLPQLDLGLSAARAKRSTVNAVRLPNNPSSSYALDAELQWEIDVWGRLGHAARAAVADAEASEADYRAARLSLAANVARRWFDAAEAEQQVQLAERTAESFQDSLAIVEEQFRRGIGDALDVRLARANYASAVSNLDARLRVRDTSLRALETLLGRYPLGGLQPGEALPAIDRPVPAGLPSQLLTRRPDLIAAERRLAASGERLSDARKNRLPRFFLTASGGTVSDSLHDLLDWDFLVWSLLGNVTQPLFQGGRLNAEQALARAEDRDAWTRYAQSVLNAFQEVETALAAEALLAAEDAALVVAAAESREAADLALDRYREGLTGIITLLESQRRAFTAESTQLSVRNQRLQNRINLHLALGGDFEQKPAESVSALPLAGVAP